MARIRKIGSLCRIQTGTYTGDGSTSQAITGIGFKPKYVASYRVIASEATIYPFEKLADFSGEFSVLVGPTSTRDNRLISLDDNGFTVDDDGGDGDPNANGVTYAYIALG